MDKLPIIKQLEDEIGRLERELNIEIPRELQKAAAHGDLRENAEYSAARERQSFLQARLTQLRSRLGSIASLKVETLPKDRVAFGSRVIVRDVESGEERAFELVSPEEVMPGKGKISVNSPLGQSLLGKVEGDEIVLSLPSGRKEYEILRFITLHEILEGEA